jgi:hypothetical protein
MSIPIMFRLFCVLTSEMLGRQLLMFALLPLKEKDPSWYISVIRQTMGYQTPVFTHPFSWRLHITITYNLPHLRLTGTNVCWCCHGNSANIRSCLPNISDVKTLSLRQVIYRIYQSDLCLWLYCVSLLELSCTRFNLSYIHCSMTHARVTYIHTVSTVYSNYL